MRLEVFGPELVRTQGGTGKIGGAVKAVICCYRNNKGAPAQNVAKNNSKVEICQFSAQP